MKCIICIGLSASGKSSWTRDFLAVEANAVKARKYLEDNPDVLGNVNYKDYPTESNWIEINRDDVRFDEFCNGVRDWSRYKWKHEKKVSDICNSQIADAAKEGKNIIISDTNLNTKYRVALIEKLQHLGYEVEIKEFPIDLDKAYQRDRLRPNSVGQEVIYKQWLQWLEYKGHKKYEPDPYLKDTVCVDVDGTIARMVSRGPFDWKKVESDEPISEVMDIVDGLSRLGYKIVFLSGRDGCCYQETLNWLDYYFSFPIELYMRAEGDMRKDYMVKKELFWNLVADKYNVKMVIDDRMQVIEQCWYPMGLKVINVGNPNERF